MDQLAAAVGVSEPALRLLVGVLVSYPLSLVYRIAIVHAPVAVRHLYSALGGLFIAWFCYGNDLVYSFAAIMATYVILAVLPRSLSLPISWIVNFGSLLLAYYYVSSAESYDIDWTTAQCVLCLRLIGFSFDYSDGSIRPEKRQPYQKKHALDRLPSVLEFLGYAYSYSGFLVGPQYSFATYSRFIGDLDKVSQQGIAFGAALKSFLFGAVYLGISTVGGGYFPVLALKGNDFLNVWPLWYRLVYVIAAMRVCLMRYGGIWMLTNGHCIMLGIGYAKGDDGRVRWDGLANFLPWRFETATNIDDLVGSFNINTNLWVKEYVFKRLRFLGNRELSLLGSLVFLAVWHGFSPGYFFNFGMEFLDQLAEARLRLLMRPLSNFASKTGGVVQMAWNFACYVTAFITLSFGFQAFELKTLEDSLNGYHAIGYISQLVPLFIIVLGTVLGPFLRERKPKAEGAKTE